MNSIADAPQQILLAQRPPVYAVADGIEVHPGMFQRVPDGASIADLCPPGVWLCHASGEWISRNDWWQPPRGGDVIVFCRAPTGKDGIRVLLTIAVIVASIWTGGAVGAAYGSAAYGAAGGAAVSIVGSALVNALVPLDVGNLQSSTDTSPTYSVTLQGNQARLEQVQPVLYGYNKTYPDYGCQPYYRFDNPSFDQYLFACLQVGLGQYQVLRVSIDDTPLQNFEDIDFKIVGPGQAITSLADQTLVETNIISATEVSGQTMVYNVWVGPFVATSPQQTVTVIEIDIVFPYGLQGPTPNYAVSWQVHARAVNDFEQAVGVWFSLGNETYAEASAKPIRLTYRYAVPAARYQVRVRRTSTRTTNPAEPHDIAWAGLRCTLSRAGVVNTDATFVVVKMRASEQLNGLSARRISVLSQRMLPVWNGSSWSAPVATRSIAWAMADVLRNTVYGRGLSDAQIDLPALLALDAVWSARQDHFDFVFDSDNDTWSALAIVLRAGRAVPLIRGSRYTAVRDALQTLPVAGYTMRNITQGTFTLSYTMPEPDEVDCIRLEYQDFRVWDSAQAVAQVVGGSIIGYAINFDGDTPAGVPEPANPVTIKMPGIRGVSQALREAAYRLADLRYRRRVATFTCEMDGRLPAFGSLVSVAHDVPDWGQSGDLVDWDTDTLTAYTSEPLDWSGSAPFFIRLQTLTGGLTAAITVSPLSGDASGCVLASNPGFTPLTTDPSRERTRYLFGPSSKYGADCRVKAIKPTGPSDNTLTVVLEDNRVHAADAPWLPGSGVQDPINDGSVSPDTDAGDTGAMVALSLYSLAAVGETDIPTPPRVTYTLRSDGVVEVSSFGGHGTLSDATLTAQWLNPQPIAPAIAGTYQARATALTVIGPAPEGALNTWQPLSTSRTWAIEGYTETISGGGDSGFTTLYSQHIVILLIEIRDTAGVVQGSARISMVVQPAEGGGGEGDGGGGF